MSRPALSFDQFENSLRGNTLTDTELNFVRARVFAGMGNEYYWQGERLLAFQFYKGALKKDPRMMKVVAKRFLISLGGPGDSLRKWINSGPEWAF
jgi:hypothetical protein